MSFFNTYNKKYRHFIKFAAVFTAIIICITSFGINKVQAADSAIYENIIGKHIAFGNYGDAAITWEVMAIDSDKGNLTLFSDRIIKNSVYADTYPLYTNWQDSIVCLWLNGSEFLGNNEVFSDSERAALQNYSEDDGFKQKMILPSFTELGGDISKEFDTSEYKIPDKGEGEKWKNMPLTRKWEDAPARTVKNDRSWYWTRSLMNMSGSHIKVWDVRAIGALSYSPIFDSLGLRPVCKLDIEYLDIVSGSGTLEDPYLLEINKIILEDKNIYAAENYGGLKIPANAFSEITGEESAVKAVSDFISTFNDTQKTNPSSLDLLTVFVEEAIAQAASVTLYGKAVNADNNSLINLYSIANNTKLSIENLLKENNIKLLRKISLTGMIKTENFENISIILNKSITSLKLDKLLIQAVSGRVGFNFDTLKNGLSDANLNINLSKSLSVSSEDIFEIGFNLSSFSDNFTFSLPVLSSTVNYQTVANQDGKIIGGKYNPVTNLMDIKIKEGGKFLVKNNRKYFNDISHLNKEVQEAIMVLSSKGIVNGTSESAFSPDKLITRAEIAALVLSAIYKTDTTAGGGGFSDVHQTDWFYYIAGAAKKYNIVSGFSDGTFRGKDVVSKEQITTILANILKSDMEYYNIADIDGKLSQFSDIKHMGDWAKPSIALCSVNGVTLLRSDGKFLPKSEMTRADAIVMIKRFYDRLW